MPGRPFALTNPKTGQFVKTITPEQITEVTRLYYDERLSSLEIARRFGWRDGGAVYLRLKLAGRSPRGTDFCNTKYFRKVSAEALLEAHATGMSVREMARHLGVNHYAIQTRLKSAGLTPNPSLRGAGEKHFLKLLAEFFPKYFTPQLFACGYFIDFGAYPIAVELVFTGGSISPGGSFSDGKRIYTLFKAGFHIVEIAWSDMQTLNKTTIDHLVAWIERTKGLPSTYREYRMIRSTGESLAVLQCNVNQLPAI